MRPRQIQVELPDEVIIGGKPTNTITLREPTLYDLHVLDPVLLSGQEGGFAITGFGSAMREAIKVLGGLSDDDLRNIPMHCVGALTTKVLDFFPAFRGIGESISASFSTPSTDSGGSTPGA